MTKNSKSLDVQLKEAKLARWKLAAKREEQELKIKKVKHEERIYNLCRIDMALDAFDGFLTEFVDMIKHLPDTVYSITKCTPDEYREVQEWVDAALVRLSNKRLYLGIESTQETKDKATEKWRNSMAKE